MNTGEYDGLRVRNNADNPWVLGSVMEKRSFELSQEGIDVKSTRKYSKAGENVATGQGMRNAGAGGGARREAGAGESHPPETGETGRRPRYSATPASSPMQGTANLKIWGRGTDRLE